MDEVKSRRSNPSEYGYTYLTPRDQPPPEVGWKDREEEEKQGVINLYSQNVVKEGDTTEEVDRESIANLHTTKQQWESIFSSNLKQPEEANVLKKKSQPKWEVKLPSSQQQQNNNNKPPSLDINSNNTSSQSLPQTTQIQVESSPSSTMEIYRSKNNHDATDNGYQESAIEYEIRIAREREEMLLQEKEERARLLSQSSSSPVESASQQSTNSPMAVISSLEAVNTESESCQPAYNELTEADRAPGVWATEDRHEEKYQNKADPSESIIEREIRLQQEKEAELGRQRQLLAQQSLAKPQGPSTPTPQHTQPPVHQQHEEIIHVQKYIQVESTPPPSAHAKHGQSLPLERMNSPVVSNSPRQSENSSNSESIIAREMRELEEREEEIRRLRSKMHGVDIEENKEKESQEDTRSSTPSSISLTPSTNHTMSRSSTLSPSQPTGPNSQGTWQREVSPFVSQMRRVSMDSGSSHSISKASSDNQNNMASRNVAVGPICDGHDSSDDEKPNYFKKQETPIEREMRVAKERENELRRMKGLPEVTNKDDFYGSYGPKSEVKETPNSNKPMGLKAPTKQSLKNVSTTRLHQEMSAQKERENSMRNEGITFSDATESIQPFKYMEVTGSQTADSSVKRNFVTKKPYSSSPAAQSQESTASSQSASISSSAPQRKSIGGGRQNFSYKDFKSNAESKIERELREMREREEELKTRRQSSTVETQQ